MSRPSIPSFIHGGHSPGVQTVFLTSFARVRDPLVVEACVLATVHRGSDWGGFQCGVSRRDVLVCLPGGCTSSRYILGERLELRYSSPGAYLSVVLGTSTRLRARSGPQAGKPNCALD